MAARLSDRAIAVLRAATCNDNQVKLNSGQLPPEVYREVDEVMRRLRGKWRGGKVAAHLFPDYLNPEPLIRMVAASGEMPDKNPTQLYPSPRPVADAVIAHLDLDLLDEGAWVLEPSAGLAGLVNPLREHEATSRIARIDAVEILPANVAYLQQYVAEHDARVCVHSEDFERWTPPPREGGTLEVFERALLNPPFKGYLRHIMRAYGFLKPGGRLAAVIPATFEGNDTALGRKLRILAMRWGDWDELPAGSFEESGTSVSTLVIWFRKPFPHEVSWRDQNYEGHPSWWNWQAYMTATRLSSWLSDLCVKLCDAIRGEKITVDEAKQRIKEMLYQRPREFTIYDTELIDWPELLDDIAEIMGIYDAAKRLADEQAKIAALYTEDDLGDDEEPVAAAPAVPADTLGQLARTLESTVAEIAAEVAALVAEVEGTQADAGPVVALAEPAPVDCPAVPPPPAAPATGGKKRGKRGTVPDGQLVLPIFL